MNNKRMSNKQEKRVAKDINGNTTIASGAMWTQKADVRNDLLLIECKTTSKCYYSLKYKTWEKIEKEALKDGLRTPVMCIDLRDGKNKIAVLNYNDFIGFNLDELKYVGSTNEPVLTEAKSYRVTPDFLYEGALNIRVYDKEFYHRLDVKFVDYNTHLVLLDWNDFINNI